MTGNEADVALVRVDLEVSAGTGVAEEPAEHVLRTTVALRNR